MQNIRASTQEHLEIADIRDNLVLLKNNNVSLVLQSTAVNFGLLSEREQDVIIYAYAALLNSLNFSVQIVIRSKRSDVSGYLNLLMTHEAKQSNPDLKKQIKQYREFVAATVQKNQVLDKSFYLIITMSLLELGIKGATAQLKGKKSVALPKDYLIEQAKTNLYPKRDHLIKQLTRIGLKAKELTTQELVELYYDIYNPTEVASQKVAEEGAYTAPMVAPAIEGLSSSQPAILPPTPQPLPQIPQPKPQPVIPAFVQDKGTEKSTPNPTIQPASQKVIGAEPQKENPPAGGSNVPNQQEALKALQEAIAKANEAINQQKGKQE